MPYNTKEKYKLWYYSYDSIKTRRICDWKRMGVICDDWDTLYEKYISTTHCELCNIELTEGKRSLTTRCLDHNHDTGLFRNVVCHSCNIRRDANPEKTKQNIKKYKKQYYQKNKHNQNQRNRRNYQNSWGGDSRCNNNLLSIDVDLFN